MRINNIEKWENELFEALKYNYHCTCLQAIGKNDIACDKAYANKMNYYERIEKNDYFECTGLYNVLKIENNETIIFIQVHNDCIEFYKDINKCYKYKYSLMYDFSANKYSYIIELTQTIEKYLHNEW